MIPFSIKIVEQSTKGEYRYVREVRLFGWLVKREEIITDGECNSKTVGFNVLPDLKEYVVEDEEL